MENRDDQNKNQTGQQGQQSAGQQGQSSTGQTGSDQGSFGQRGGDTSLAQGQAGQMDKDKQRSDEAGADKSFVGSSKEDDTSEAYLSEKETGKSDFAAQGQGASSQNEDIESGTSATRDASIDDDS